uniref:Uncharacterized protein n=1 Tax=Clytia hemisphaerica TaxID=252671 RepID=A0A7M5X051_9CNID
MEESVLHVESRVRNNNGATFPRLTSQSMMNGIYREFNGNKGFGFCGLMNIQCGKVKAIGQWTNKIWFLWLDEHSTWKRKQLVKALHLRKLLGWVSINYADCMVRTANGFKLTSISNRPVIKDLLIAPLGNSPFCAKRSLDLDINKNNI